MYQNTIYICISWYSKICWFPVKKCWCQHNSTGASGDLYIVWIFFDHGRTVPSFIFVGYVWQILGRGGGAFGPAPILEQHQKSPSWIGLMSSNLLLAPRNLFLWQQSHFCLFLLTSSMNLLRCQYILVFPQEEKVRSFSWWYKCTYLAAHSWNIFKPPLK